MRKITAVAAIAALTGPLCADVITLNPVADAFVSSAQPNGNFGGAGALSVAAAGLPQGEFQTVLRFDTASAIAGLNATYGPGNWSITGVSLIVTSTSPNNAIFNSVAAGGFSVSWMQNDSWVEGTGGPSSPSATGITFASLPSFLSPADEPLGTYAYSGATTGTVTSVAALSPGFTADIAAGGPVSLRMAASTATTAWVFNSRTFGTASSRPVLSITTVPAPGAAAVFLLAAAGAGRRRR